MILHVAVMFWVLVSIASSSTVTLSESDVRGERVVSHLFGKPFLILHSEPFVESASLMVEHVRMILFSETDKDILDRLRCLEQCLYDYFVENKTVQANEFCSLVFPRQLYANYSEPFSLSHLVIRLNGVEYFSILKLYYELMRRAGQCRQWCPFEESIVEGAILSGPFGALPNDIIKKILLTCISSTPNAIKVLPMVCKKFHSINISRLAVKGLSSMALSRLVLLTHSPLHESFESCHIYSYLFSKDTHDHDDLLVEQLQQRQCKFIPILRRILKEEKVNRFITIMANSPSRTTSLLESIGKIIDEGFDTKRIVKFLNIIFGLPSFWQFIKMDELMLRRAALLVVKKENIIKYAHEPSARYTLERAGKFYDTFERFLPFFDSD